MDQREQKQHSSRSSAVAQATRLLQTNKPDEALHALQTAVFSPDADGQTHAMLADLLLSRFRALLAASKGNAAIATPDELVTTDVDRQILNELDLAIAHYRHALKRGHDSAELHNNYGIALTYRHDDEEAIVELGKAVMLDSNSPHTEWILAKLLVKARRYDEAFVHWKRAATALPNHPGLLHTAGQIYFAAQRFHDAIEAFKKAAAIAPEHVAIQQDLGVAYAATGRYDLAIPLLQSVLRSQPNDFVAQEDLAVTYSFAQRPQDAIEIYRNAIRLDPTNVKASYRLCLLYLAAGQFEPAWEKYSLRWTIGDIKPLAETDLNDPRLKAGPIYIYGDQGIGDELFFLRFVPQLRARGQRVHYCPSSKLEPIVRRLDCLDEVIPANLRRTLVAQNPVAVSDLPRLLSMRSTTQIPPSLCLAPLPDRVATMRERLAAAGPPPYIAVTWRAGTRNTESNPKLRNLLFKEVPIDMIGVTLRGIPGTVVVLQRLPDEGEYDTMVQALQRPAHDFSALNNDLEDMLALLSLLDEYVTVSNANVHLLAGLGKTARVLIPQPPEWRWMAKGSESPWFPGFRLYRRDTRLDWDRAFSDLRRDLREALSTTS